MLCQVHLTDALEKGDGLVFYSRIFSPLVTLWCMVYQRLNSDHSLQAAVCHLHAGGADPLSPPEGLRLSKRVKSLATTAFSEARKRLPLTFIASALSAQARDIWKELGAADWHGWRVLLLDGTQLRVRPFAQVTSRFAASSNQHGKAYWVLMRVVATFCLQTGVVVASAAGSACVSEQALACQQLLEGLSQCLYLGDRNFGVFWMIQTVLLSGNQCLFRLTQPRARKLAGSGRRLRRTSDRKVSWAPSRADLKHPECKNQTLSGRLIVARYCRAGFRPQWLFLFTTLVDAEAYPAAELVALYGTRWQVELNLRYLKTQMDLHQLECKSADMAEKEWLAGLMAYNLVRSLMMTAALKEGITPAQLSFSATTRLLLLWLADWSRGLGVFSSWEVLLERLAKTRQPKRAKPRLSEPRAKRHLRETFPPLRGSRPLARKKLKQLAMKS